MRIESNNGFWAHFNLKIAEVVDYDGLVLNVHGQHFAKNRYAVYNTEVLKYKLFPEYREFLDKADVVYDYSFNNLKYYPRAIFCPIKVSSISHRVFPKQFDVLFYGVMSPRRRFVFSALQDVGLTCEYAENIYGSPLHDLIAKSKVVLSMGTYGCENNDSARIIPAIEMGGTVVAEKCEEKWFNNYISHYMCHVVPTEKLVETCIKICR